MPLAIRRIAALLVPLTSFALATALAQAPRDEPARDSVRLAEIRVIGTADALAGIPGSGSIVDRETLLRSRAITMGEVLRRVPGVHARDEEGFGLRPNIGIRGLNPTRSSRVLLLEDGIPLTIAPYGANESYYHPPMERFERIEVLKGSGQILFGPQTIGGVINYITTAIPARRGGEISLTPGNRDYFNGQLRYGGTFGPAGFLAGYTRKQGHGARANTGSAIDDVTLKAQLVIGARQLLTLRGNYYGENSNVTYSGLTESEYAAEPRFNPFRNDSMFLDRRGASATHRLALSTVASLTTSLYGYTISRDWWRQSSFSDQRPNDRSDSTCAGMANLNTTCGDQGRLRDYAVWGIEPRLHVTGSAFTVPAVLDAGVRAHFETQDRRQVNGATPNARTAGPVSNVNSGVLEDNLRRNQAYSAFVQGRFLLGPWTVSPGVRVEHVRYQRTNRLQSVSGRTALTQLVPGLGATYGPSARVTVFAGVHRGFAPPRTEDLISNATGGVVDLEPELSWNWELGVRAEPAAGVSLEGTLFRLDFENQIIPASLAGGAGSALTSAGRTLHQGLEVAGQAETGLGARSPHRFLLRAAWTYVPTARFEGPRYVYVGTGGSDVVGKVYAGQNASGTRTQLSVTGNRLPYAPRGTLSASVGYRHGAALDLRLEAVFVGAQFGDALNTRVTVPDGQQGVIPAYTVWNAAVNYEITATRTTVFLTAKNLFERTYVVDRTRGILPGSPRLVHAGVVQRL